MSTAMPPPTPETPPAASPAATLPPMPGYPQTSGDYPFPEPPTDLIDNDGVPLESDWHRLEMTLLIDSVTQRMGERRDYFVGGNMFVYFSEVQARNLDYRGPDFFFVDGVPFDKPRKYWAIWDEGGKYPDVIIELGSHTTIKYDRTIKKDIYEKLFKAPDYFIYYPEKDVFEGFTWTVAGYEPKIPNDKGWLWCNVLGLWLGRWSGAYQDKTYLYLRWYDRDGNLIPTIEEAAQQRAEVEKQRAEAEKQRAEAAEAELARLKSLLAQQTQEPHQ